MDKDRPNFFAGPYIERRAEAREAADWLETALADAGALFVLGRGTAQLVRKEPQLAVEFVGRAHPLLRGLDRHRFVLLGWFRGSRCLLAEIDPLSPVELAHGTAFEELRALAPGLPADEAGLLAYARAMAIWRARHQYCGLCGALTLAERAGHLMRCIRESCRHEFFPRLDPAIIVLVTDGERALLGRQRAWPPGRYSTIAGFVEPGESLEDAVAREVMEETGVPVTRVRYDSSQPWPFPSSLMVGFQAQARPGSRIVVGDELEDAQWFTRAQIRSDGLPLIPPSHSISYRLITTWLEDDG